VPSGGICRTSNSVRDLGPLTAATAVVACTVQAVIRRRERGYSVSQVQAALEAWRAAQRRFDAEPDPRMRMALETEVDALHRQYLHAASVASDEYDVPGHATESEKPRQTRQLSDAT
jgi:hypothetical protein